MKGIMFNLQYSIVNVQLLFRNGFLDLVAEVPAGLLHIPDDVIAGFQFNDRYGSPPRANQPNGFRILAYGRRRPCGSRMPTL